MSKFGVPTEAQMVKINKHSRRTLSADEVFVYPHKMAGDMIIPERYIQLMPPLLDKFAKDANAGVSFLLDHSWSGFFARPKAALPYGRVFEGEVSKVGVIEGETISFNGTTYIVRGQEKDGISNDAIISDIETGVMIDTSIGWGAEKFICSICGNDIRDWRKCEHIQGKKYIVNEDTGEIKLCWAMASPPGYLMEDSGVFDGAYPGAGTSLSVAAIDGYENETGLFTVFDDFKGIPLNACIYGTYSKRGGVLTFVKKSGHKKVYAGGLAAGGNGDDVDPGGQVPGKVIDSSVLSEKGGDIPMDKVKKMLDAFGVNADDLAELEGLDMLSVLAEKWDNMVQHIQESAAPVAMFMTQEQADAALGKEYSAEEVLKFAKEGIEHHTDVIDDAIKWGVRAMGNEFPVKTWKSTFAGMATKQIMDIMRTFEAKAKAEIPAGRMSDPEGGKGQPRRHVPEELYRVGR